jgi:arginyl-tRNA--protein-N-Asp/Glu arginylyltransferase
MSIKGVLLQPVIDECPYIDGYISVNENMLISDLEENDMELLLNAGFRHFGQVFFRPICTHCRLCISVRIPVQRFSPSGSTRRLFNRNKHLTVTLEKPEPSGEHYKLYNLHKQRFSRRISESYDVYVKSFFYPFPFNRVLTIRDGEKLVAVTHLDVTTNAMSAIYCYFDLAYGRFSPGKYSIYKEIMIAKEMGIQWLYLGFYIPRNRHTEYKVDFKPNQFLGSDNKWHDYMDAEGHFLNPLPLQFAG